MALTIEEASAVNTLLDWLADDGRVRAETDVPFYLPTSQERAREALLLLTHHASKKLGAGWRAGDLDKYLPQLPKAAAVNPKEAA